MVKEIESVTFGTVLNMPAVVISGPFDFMSSKIDTFVEGLIGKGTASIVLDLSASHYLTSMGIATIFKLIKKINAAGGMLHIAGATDDMKEVIQLSNVNAYVSYIDDY
jgi:anti-anti-sigma factor